MSLQHFFLEKQSLYDSIEASNNIGFSLDLAKDDLRHAKVLRLKPGEHIGVIDAEGVYFECEILKLEDELFVKNAKKKDNAENNIEIWLVPGIPKSNKLDDVIRACTETGIDGFLPTIFNRSIVKLDKNKSDSKLARWKIIAKSAAMQSGQIRIPKIENIYSFSELCNKLNSFDEFIICWEESNDHEELLTVIKNLKSNSEHKKIAIIIGPEGGITEEEVHQLSLTEANANIVSLGNSILRSETACIAACSIVKFLLTC